MVKAIERDLPFAVVEKALFAAHSNATSESALPLAALRPGQEATVSQVHADPHLKMRLMELGFVAGSPVSFLMPTPFGDPCIYRLRGSSIALRKSEATCIRVKTAKP